MLVADVDGCAADAVVVVEPTDAAAIGPPDRFGVVLRDSFRSLQVVEPLSLAMRILKR